MIRNAAEVCGSRSTVPETIPPPPLPLHFVPSFSFSSFGGFFFPSPPLSLSLPYQARSVSLFLYTLLFPFLVSHKSCSTAARASQQDRSALHHLLILLLVFSSLVYIFVYTFCTILVFIFFTLIHFFISSKSRHFERFKLLR